MIEYIDRVTRERCQEQVFGEGAIRFLYGNSFWSKLLGRPLAEGVARLPFISSTYAFFQKLGTSRHKILPFIEKYGVDPAEFADSVDSFQSFNDFFIRKLTKEARPLAPGANVAVMPADARYLFYQDIDAADGFIVKGQKFSLGDLFQDAKLAEEYQGGTMILARLCPSDYHRFHFPCACVPGETHLLNGLLYSVNPVALKRNVEIFTQNRRTLCLLETGRFGKVVYMEVGATNVGAIHETYTPFHSVPKGAEKGYFSFGGSALVLLFKRGTIKLDEDLTRDPHTEIRCLLGQSLGVSSCRSP